MNRRSRINTRRAARIALAGAAFAGALPALAAHPLISEDPGTQGAGHWELELGFSDVRGDPVFGRADVGQPQLSYGALATLDVIVQGTYARVAAPDGGHVSGPGDTVLDAKWRFYESGSLALALRGGMDAPTGDEDKGLSTGHVGMHGVAILGWTTRDGVLLANAGYVRARQSGLRANVGRVTAALLSPADKRLQGFIEGAAQSNADPARGTWPAVARTGLIYSLTPMLDVDFGFQARLNGVAPRQVLLAGATLRW
jgi:hypothetical protein